MSIEKFIEEKIRKAMDEGEFENLKGAGKPLNLDAYFAAPEDIRLGCTLLKNNDFVPEEVELLKEIGVLRKKLKNCASGAEKQSVIKKLNAESLALTIILETNKRKSKFCSF